MNLVLLSVFRFHIQKDRILEKTISIYHKYLPQRLLKIRFIIIKYIIIMD